MTYDINRKTAKISASSSGKIDQYEYHAGEEILPSNQTQITEQVCIFSLRKIFRKTNKKTSWCFKVSKKDELK